MINIERKKQLDKLIGKIDLNLNKYYLLNIALTHPSYVFENGQKRDEHNQRLEFLGDAVVGLIVGEYLYKEYPNKTEGELTKIRAAVVCEASLARAANRLGLGPYLLMGKGEKLAGGSKRNSNLADAYESVVGALYLELGLDKIKDFTLKYIMPDIEKVISGDYGDYKTQLQEHLQKQQSVMIEYKIISEEGPDHDKEFKSGVFINEKLYATGKGKTKKEAEQKAAEASLRKMDILK
ncbi:RNAse III [Desulfonispora thiosulfatigenes DSM 11270]|uniref:Ribonuclease 3 n=1 Tax=Desulfonispora thiosulfatigenes DSM 11270 TaxID=656914 RepID=A0A1W1VK26_DESTI|nr:ribonuclease III [Desulfonispora thiosulfatigenes]SMB93633.1 RNAse III [Desulfonispora thiosulfatigenes DSM 11270]